jgi:hypothetical protein
VHQRRQLGIRVRGVNLQGVQDATIKIVQGFGIGRHFYKVLEDI